MEAPLHVSNLMLIDPKTGTPTRVGMKITDKGQKVRVAKKSGETIK
jgi:large subunit ribosomal protein L24